MIKKQNKNTKKQKKQKGKMESNEITTTTGIYNPTTGIWSDGVGNSIMITPQGTITRFPMFRSLSQTDMTPIFPSQTTGNTRFRFPLLISPSQTDMDTIVPVPTFPTYIPEIPPTYYSFRRTNRRDVLPAIVAAILAANPYTPLQIELVVQRQMIGLPSDEDLRNDKKSTDEENQCVSCYENIPNCRIEPCGHVCQCVKCSLDGFKKNKLKACPICRSDVTKVLCVE